MFSDRVRVAISAGKGGDGAAAFRREKWVPRGGPSGGDGGRGGDVVLVADRGLRDLTALRYRPHVRAKAGRPGEGSLKTGADASDVVVPVPVGTQVLDEEGAVLADLAHAGARAVIARGGRGGRGNARFATATRQAPRTAEVGEEGDELEVVLQLKLPADAALLGFPNVGKSSLLRRISNATPKVADYPFTTIEPVLGTVDGSDGRQLTVVDVPGLLEGAADGVGLGHAFLAHLERARILLHVLDAALPLEEARTGFEVIYRELLLHGHGLAERARIVVLNRIDLVPEDERAGRVEAFRAAVVEGSLAADARVARDDDGAPVVLATSCATGEGIPGLVGALFRLAPEAPDAALAGEDELADYLVFRPGRRGERHVRLLREEGTLRVVGAHELEPLARAADAEEPGAAEALDAALRERGVLLALRRAGARDGQEVRLGGTQFVYEREREEP